MPGLRIEQFGNITIGFRLTEIPIGNAIKVRIYSGTSVTHHPVGNSILRKQQHRLGSRRFYFVLDACAMFRHLLFDVPKVADGEMPQLVGSQLALLTQHDFTKFKNFPFYVPAFLILHFCFYKTYQQRGEFLLYTRLAQQRVDAFAQEIFGAKLYLKAGGQLQLTRKTTHDALHKAVDGADGEIGIVVQDVAQHQLRPRLHSRCVALNQFAIMCRQSCQHSLVFVVGGTVGHQRQILQDAVFHLGGGFVGEGDGQDVPVILRLLHHQIQVFFYQRVGLARTGGRFINGETHR